MNDFCYVTDTNVVVTNSGTEKREMEEEFKVTITDKNRKKRKSAVSVYSWFLLQTNLSDLTEIKCNCFWKFSNLKFVSKGSFE